MALIFKWNLILLYNYNNKLQALYDKKASKNTTTAGFTIINRIISWKYWTKIKQQNKIE